MNEDKHIKPYMHHVKYYETQLLYDWTIKDDAGEYVGMGEWFYNRFLDIGKKQAAPSNMDMYPGYMNEPGWTKFRGMGEVFVSVRGQSFAKEPWQIRDFFRKLPGTREKVRAKPEGAHRQRGE